MSDAAAIADEMQAITRRAAEPWMPGDSVKAAIGRAARALGIGHRRARSFWYAQSVAVRATEADQLRAADQLLLVARRRRLEQELAAIRARLDAAESAESADEAQATAASAVARRKADSGSEVAGRRVNTEDRRK